MAAILPRDTTHGTFPWNIPNKRLKQTNLIDDIYYGCDNSDRITACLNCGLTECVNCYGETSSERKEKYVRRTYRKDKECQIHETFRQLYAMNLSRHEIESRMGISKSTYLRHKKMLINETQTING